MKHDAATATDWLSEIVSRNSYLGEGSVQLVDLDGWTLEDLQDALQIIDNEVADRCNRAIEETQYEFEDRLHGSF